MKRLAILISGGGTTAEATIQACRTKTLAGLIPIVICSNKNAKGNERTKNLGINPFIVHKEDYVDRKKFDKDLLELLNQVKADIISLQGWLPLISYAIVAKYKGKIINQHPGPIDPGRPDFGGKGMSTPYRTNSARIAYVWATGEDPWTESNTHFVTEDFDMGGIIRVEKMPLPIKRKRITIQSLRKNPEELIQVTHDVQKKFYPVEHHNVIKTLQLFSNETVKEYKRKYPLIPKENIPILEDAKKLAISIFPNYNL